MASVSAVLATWKKNRQGRCPVYIRVSDVDGRKLKATGILVTERQWNPKKGRVRDSVTGADQHNAKITRMIAAAERTKAQMDLEGVVATPADLAAAIEEKAPVRRKEAPTVLSEYALFVASKRARCRASTMEVYEAMHEHLEAWLGQAAKLSDISGGWLHDFGTYLIGEGLGNSTVNKYTTRARGFLLWLETRGLIDRAPRAERLPTARNTAVYLTMEELERLMSCDLSGEKAGYRAARDLFMAGALTGQRFSDLRAMRWEEIDLEGGWWNSPTIKTAATTRVPLAAPIRRIIEARQGRSTPLPKLSNQKCNQYLKEVCRIAGIDAPVTTQKLKGAEREVVTRQKHELVTTHAARRTFVTLALQNDVPVTALLGLTHDDLRTLRLYAGQSDREREKHVNRLFGGL